MIDTYFLAASTEAVMLAAKMPQEIQLELTDKTWKHELVSVRLISATGEDVAYEGEALVSVGESQGHLLTGKVQCSALRRTFVSLALAVSETARVSVFCNEVEVWSGPLTVQDSRRTVHVIKAEVTKQKESRLVSQISIRIFFPDKPGSVWVLLSDQVAGKPAVNEVLSWPYSAWTSFVYSAAWGTILSLLVVGLSLSRLIADPRLAAPIALISGLLGYLGLKEVAKFRLRERLRDLYGWSRVVKRPYGLALPTLVLIPCLLAAAVCLYGAWRRYDYTVRIDSYFTERNADALREAFIREPWRREAQILFEQVALSLRASRDREKFVSYVRILTDSDRVRSAIDQVGQKPPFYLTADPTVISDPVVWFSSWLPEGDHSDEWLRTDQAIERLDGRTGCGAILQRQVLQLERIQSDETQLKAEQATLKRQLELCSAQDSYSYPIQLALDMLGQYSIVVEDSEGAVGYFQQLLNFRSTTPKSVRSAWRPPDKLVLYHLFRYYFDTPASPDDPIKTRAIPLLEWNDFKSVFESKVYNLSTNEKFRKQDGWREGTIFDPQLIDDVKIRETMDKGWRL